MWQGLCLLVGQSSWHQEIRKFALLASSQSPTSGTGCPRGLRESVDLELAFRELESIF